ncbi:tlde1 domain-containing protein [Aminobacter sp. Piv2-1]|uniref:tlde1 domain-containing protein n=1 Tax=Aminobacter sp. Piv2-1 TaxID=3031122 RepID=UPI003097961F
MSKIVPAQSLRRLLRPLLITSLGTAFAGAAVWSVAGMVAVGSAAAFGPGQLMPRQHHHSLKQAKVRAPVAYVSTDKAARTVISKAHPAVLASVAGSIGKSALHAEAGHATRFDAVVSRAALTSERLAALFAQTDNPGDVAEVPAADRFASPAEGVRGQALLAYADPAAGADAGTALSTLLVGPEGEGAAAAQDPDAEADATAAVPVYEETPSDGPLPQPSPRAGQSNVQPETAAEPKAAAGNSGEAEPARPQAVASARPDEPAQKKNGGSLGQSLRSLFGGGTRAGNGVAVYDISAAKVYMPDGSVLEAHSGIGKMADDPRYVNVKMNGPTPPHTYNLRMREARFHGVEAIRMLPVDGRNKYGRDGFLTHSYLLRGGREESHGCVAFADYPRFLAAFKAGKVKQLVVVPNGGRESFRLASNGKTI